MHGLVLPELGNRGRSLSGPAIGVSTRESGTFGAPKVEVPQVAEMSGTLPGVVITRQGRFAYLEPSEQVIQHHNRVNA
jgi:hypothetical protein